jgi:hypothetical protein
MLYNIVISLLGGFVGAVITLYFQNYFWGHQRISELRLRTIERLNLLAAEVLNNTIKDSQFRPGDQFFLSLTVVDSDIKALFHKEKYKLFKDLEVMIPKKSSVTLEEFIAAFIKARDAVLRALYEEFVTPRLFRPWSS